jgi:S-DNA-T family DNA segregation ATPase FtsK/SpoIIIE
VWALAAQEIASRDGLTTSRSAVPDSIHFRELLLRRETGVDQRPRRAHSLESRPAAGVRGPFVVDLVASGPHAIVGGTTGSGKSELLISWVLAMAAESSPDEVTFLLVDFKGGSAFAHLARLPHTVGIITDLDDAMANRAFSSLRAELKHRERILAQAGVRDISEFVHLPRLVIVVDEFAAMMADYPQLHALFSDIAARGRSLGVHLILCTQRPSGVMHDSLLANADLRISLRVNNGADSSAVIGSTRAVELPSRTKGRAWVVHGSLPAELVQFALATPSDVLAVAERWPAAHSPRRPWCEPLPGKILLAAVAELSITLADHVASRAHRSSATDNLTVLFGITDLPDEQRQGIAGWSPSSDGHLLVVGAPGSGKSVAIATIAAATSNHPAVDWRGTTKVLVARRDPAAFWDLIAQLHAQLDCEDLHESESSWTLLAIDDLDAIISRFDDEYRAAVLERLARLLREGNAHNIGVVASAQRITPALHSLAQLMPETLRLRIGNREDFVLSGGASIDYNPALPPGGGIWKGVRVQVAISGTSPPVLERTTVPTLQGTENIVIATSRPASATAALAAAGWQVRTLGGAPGSESDLLIADTERPIALVGTIDEWQSRWGALALLRAHATVLLDRCSLSDYRQLTRTRELPPPLTTGAAEFWRVIEGGGADRVRLPR